MADRELFEKQWGISVASQSVPLYLHPLETRMICVAYTPFSASASSGFLYIRQVFPLDRGKEKNISKG